MGQITFIFSTWHSIISYLISLFTWSLWSHVDWKAPNCNDDMEEVLYSAWWPDGVRGFLMWERIAKSNKCSTVSIPATEDQVRAISEFIRVQYGKPYDLIGALGLGVNRDWQRDDKWFCSELTAAALIHIDYPGAKEAFGDLWRVSPQVFRDFVMNVEGSEMEYVKK